MNLEPELTIEHEHERVEPGEVDIDAWLEHDPEIDGDGDDEKEDAHG